MKRREFIKMLALGLAGFGVVHEMLAQGVDASPAEEGGIKDYLYKMEHFDEPHRDDHTLDGLKYKIFKSTLMRLRRLEQLAGHGNFQLLSFNRGLALARRYSMVGRFSKEETDFMEAIFYEDGRRYGFYGQKPMKKITDRIMKKDVVWVPSSGNFIYKGRPFETYKKIRKEIGGQALMTSGVRGVMKQFLLFFNKAFENSGNLSLASRSLAPPGYSFHGNGDFDIGQAGLGALNFTQRFLDTEVYKRAGDLGYLKLRYPRKNLLGVRYEPWHIKVGPDV